MFIYGKSALTPVLSQLTERYLGLQLATPDGTVRRCVAKSYDHETGILTVELQIGNYSGRFELNQTDRQKMTDDGWGYLIGWE